MRKIEYIAIHCTGTVQNASIEGFKKYWKDTLKWSTVGYHVIIKAGGERVQLLGFDLVSNGIAGFNHNSINIAYIGGLVNKNNYIDTRTEQQKISILMLLKYLKMLFPEAIIQGHRDFPNVHKACPCFNAKIEYKNL